MNKRPDVVVVGAGLMGLFTARELAQAGVNVALIERQSTGQEASWAGGGILSPLYPWRSLEDVNKLTFWGQAIYRNLIDELTQETAIDAQWVPCGMLMLGVSDAHKAQHWAAQYGITFEHVMGDGFLCSALARSHDDSLAVFLPDVAHVRNPRLLKALKVSLLRNSRVRLYEHTLVTGVIFAGDQVTGVTINHQETFDCDCVVVTGGAWTAVLLQSVMPQLTIKPVLGQMLLYKAEPGLVSHIILRDGHYIIPRKDGRVLVGSTLEHTGFDKRITVAACEALQQFVAGLLPQLNAFPIERQWSGLRPGSLDGVPTISQHPRIKGLYVNAGHYRNGVVMAPASCRLMADLVLNRTPLIDPSAYQL